MSNCPARAGFTGPRRPADAPRWDHPRSRGVYLEVDPAGAQLWGSSPLARGLPMMPLRAHEDFRIIPARAGFTVARRGSLTRSEDHPRSRGVYHGAPPDQAGLSGSSPLARGLRHRVGGSAESGGIIPARAGFTILFHSSVTTALDHPRSRGVYSTSCPG